MRLNGMVAIFLPVLFANAAISPGGPPWSCHVYEACNAAGQCGSLLGFSLGFQLSKIDRAKNLFAMEGYNSRERTVALAPTPQEAERFLREIWRREA